MLLSPEKPINASLTTRWNFKRFLRAAKLNKQGLISIGPRQIYILPTRFGIMFGTLIIAMLIGAINYANNLGYLLTFFLGAIGVLAIVHTWKNLLDLQVNIEAVTQAVFAGQSFEMSVNVSNPTKQFRGPIQIDERASSSFDIQEISPSSKQGFKLILQPESRGWYKINQLVLSTQYPLGLLRAWVYINSTIKILVYPQPADKWQVPNTAVYSLSTQGDKGIGADDFVAHRNYRYSDSPKQIDWKIFAREKGLMTKQFGGDRSERLWLTLDLLPDIPLEKALQKLTRAILDADSEKLEYGLKLPGKVMAISHGYKHKHDCLKALALFNTKAVDRDAGEP